MKTVKEYPTLSKAPVENAILEIRYRLKDEGFNEQIYKKATEEFKLDFPKIVKGYNRELSIIGDEKQAKASIQKTEQVDQRFWDKEDVHAITISPTIFNFNKRGYETWEEFYKRFELLWDKFLNNIINPELLIIVGISVRYINRILIENLTNPSDYFNTTIYADKDVMSGIVHSYIMRYVLFLPEDGTQINITQGSEPRIGNNTPYLFDLDVICNEQIKIEEIRQKFNILRNHKNKLFFSNLTSKTIEILK